ncbi:MAG: iron ABC transporter permease [Pseudohongiellaceae bacterium]
MTRVFSYLSLLLIVFLFLPLAGLLVSSFYSTDISGSGSFGTENYQIASEIVGNLDALGWSVAFAAGSALLATVMGTATAWLFQRTDIPFRRSILILTLVPMFIPGVIYTYSWILLTSPEIGLLNKLIRLTGQQSPLDIYSFAGMVWVDGIKSAPMVVLIVGAMLRSFDPQQEMAARLAGASIPKIFFSITCPLLLPAIGASFLLLFIRGIGTFETPAMLGGPIGIELLSYNVYRAFLDYPLSTGPVAASSMPLLLLALFLVFIHERLVKPRNYQISKAYSVETSARLLMGSARIPLGAGFLLLSIAVSVLPLSVVFWSSLNPYFIQPSLESLGNLSFEAYREIFASSRVADASVLTLKLSGIAATAIVAAGIIMAWVMERTRHVTASFIEPSVDTLLAVPGIIIGLAILVLHTRFDTGLYGTSTLLFLVYLTKHLPQGLRFVRAGLAQVPQDLEQAARCSGAGETRVLTRITIPLMVPAAFAGWLYVITLCARDLSGALLLYSPGEEVLSVLLWQYWESGQIMQLSALSMLFLLPLVIVAAVVRFITKETGFSHA